MSANLVSPCHQMPIQVTHLLRGPSFYQTPYVEFGCSDSKCGNHWDENGVLKDRPELESK